MFHFVFSIQNTANVESMDYSGPWDSLGLLIEIKKEFQPHG